jgi:hypothetical protein
MAKPPAVQNDASQLQLCPMKQFQDQLGAPYKRKQKSSVAADLHKKTYVTSDCVTFNTCVSSGVPVDTSIILLLFWLTMLFVALAFRAKRGVSSLAVCLNMHTGTSSCDNICWCNFVRTLATLHRAAHHAKHPKVTIPVAK